MDLKKKESFDLKPTPTEKINEPDEYDDDFE
jgi:hypothetical protein